MCRVLRVSRAVCLFFGRHLFRFIFFCPRARFFVQVFVVRRVSILIKREYDKLRGGGDVGGCLGAAKLNANDGHRCHAGLAAASLVWRGGGGVRASVR